MAMRIPETIFEFDPRGQDDLVSNALKEGLDEECSIRIALMLGTDDRSGFGGMEVHGTYFETFFSELGILSYVVERESLSCRDVATGKNRRFLDVESVGGFLSRQGVGVLFFNTGHWVEDLLLLRKNGLQRAKFLLRSGGNEIVKAPWHDMTLPLKIRQEMWAKSINDNVDFLVVNSTYSVNRACDLGICRDLIVVARGGVDLQTCEKNKRRRRENRNAFVSRHGCEGKTLLGIVSRLEAFKGVMPVLSVLKRHQALDWHLVIVGDGREKGAILDCLRAEFSPQKYTFVGVADHPTAMRIISLVDWILNCSLEYERESGEGWYVHTETMGRTMVESICQGTPIVATHVGGIRELFYENDFPGMLLTSAMELETSLPAIVQNRHRLLSSPVEALYSWHAIFDGLYVPLMSLPLALRTRTALVVDIDGTVSHDFLRQSDNDCNLARILGLRRTCSVILNTARGYEELLMAYPSVARCKGEICIIADCGARISVLGTVLRLGDWLPAPGRALEQEVEWRLSAGGCVWRERRSVNRLYVNYKIEGDVAKIEDDFNSEYKDVGFELYHNASNLKLVSRHVNKGQALGFVLRHCLCADFVVGAGNNVLDASFLSHCDRRYIVNSDLNVADGIHVHVGSQRDMDEFLKRIEDDVGQE